MSSRKEQESASPMLLRVAIGIGVAVVSGIAAMFFYNRQQEAERPHANNNYTQDSRICSICLDTLANRQVRFLACGHIFHNHCITSWGHRQNMCPMCRKPLNLVED